MSEATSVRIDASVVQRLVQLIRRVFRDWSGFDDPRFVEEEVTYKQEAARLASELLGRDALGKLRDKGDYSELIDRVKRVGHATNLLFLGVPRQGDLAAVQQPGLDTEVFSAAFFDLLYGEGDSIARLGRYLRWAEQTLPSNANKWTFPTYFLFLLFPNEEILVKPRTTKDFLRFIGSDLVLESDPEAETYRAIRRLFHELKVGLEAYGPRDMIDLQGFVWVAMKQARASDGPIDEEIIEAFERFREEPAARFRRALHLHRIQELQELLSVPDALDVDTFDADVWRLESTTLLRGEEIERGIGEGIDQSPYSEQRYRELERALKTGELELHGNYIWGSGSKIYAPQIQEDPPEGSDLAFIVHAAGEVGRPATAEDLAERARDAGWDAEEAVSTVNSIVRDNPDFFERDVTGRIRLLTEDESRLRNIRQVAETLVDHSLEPIEKAKAIMRIKGFGRNTATGLVMVFHPDEFAMYNTPSKGGLERLGFRASTLEEFQTSAAKLKDALGAADFLELDTFLYLIGTDKLSIGEPPDDDGASDVTTVGIDGTLRAYSEPPFEEIVDAVRLAGMKISERLLRRYHLSLQTRGFVILSGISGTGKTWLTRLYADAVGAEYRLVPVAPNWTSNEDLLGFWNPLTDAYHDTPFSRFLREAADEYDRATSVGVLPKPYHLALDELNLARVEYYFARFLSAMEVRARHGSAEIQLGPDNVVTLPENLFFVGTINVDETTHGFADKVFDRAQLLELEAPRDLLWRHLGESQYRDTVMAVWDEVERIAPFAFRVLDDIQAYVALAEDMGVGWEEAVDEQLVQKVLPKLKGADPRIGQALLGIIDVAGEDLPLTREKAREMNETFNQHGFTSYF